MNKKAGLLAMLTSLPLFAGTMGEMVPVNPWFGSIGAGYSWTNKPGIENPNPALWDFANEGYDSSLGNRSFYTLSIGKQVHEYVDLSLMYLNHEIFNYQKTQTGSGDTLDFTGNARVRYFELANKALLFNGFIHPSQYLYNVVGVELMPYVGAGVGFSNNEVRNFYTVGNTAVAPGVIVGSTSSIGEIYSINSFSWQGTVGLNIRPSESHASANIGYRYFSGGNFEGPSVLFTTGTPYQAAPPWQGHLRANQLFVELKYTV